MLELAFKNKFLIIILALLIAVIKLETTRPFEVFQVQQYYIQAQIDYQCGVRI